MALIGAWGGAAPRPGQSPGQLLGVSSNRARVPVLQRPTSNVQRPAVATYTLTEPTRALIDLLNGQVFTDSGRFFPCRTNPSCKSWGEDIALSSPNLSVDGPRIVFSVHLVGSYAMSQFFAATVGGDLIISGVPTTRGNHIVMTQTQATASPTSDMAFRAFLEATHGRVESIIEQSPGFDLAQYLSYAAANPQVPPPRLPDFTCLDPSQVQVQSVTTQPTKSAVVATVSVGPPPPGKCGG